MADNTNRKKGNEFWEILLVIILAAMFVIGSINSVTPKTESITTVIRAHGTGIILLSLLVLVAFKSIVQNLFDLIDRKQTVRNGGLTYSHIIPSVTTWLKHSGIIVLCWMPYLIVCYPTITRGYDYFWQLLQGTGVLPLSNHHPVFASFTYGALFKAGYHIGGASFGLFFSTLVQMLLLACAAGFCFSTFCSARCVPKAMRIVLIAVVCLCPVFPGHTAWLVKDSLFTAVGLFFFSQIYLRIKLVSTGSKPHGIASYPATVVSAFIFSLLRNGTAPVVIMTFLVLFYAEYKYQTKLMTVKKAAAIASFLICTIIWNQALSVMDVYPTNIREALSMPTRQIIRTIQLHPESFSSEDRKILKDAYHEQISYGFTIGDIAARYDDMNADYIKVDYVEDKEFIKEYVKLWIKMAVRHPGSYADAFFRGTDGYWDPMKSPHLEAMGTVIHTVCTDGPENDFASESMRTRKLDSIFTPTVRSLEHAGIDTQQTFEDLFDRYPWLDELMHVESAFPDVRLRLGDEIAKIETIPVISMILAPGTYFWLMLICLSYLFSRRKIGRFLWPVILLDFIAWLSPVNGYTRYVLLVEFFSIILIGACFDSGEDVES